MDMPLLKILAALFAVVGLIVAAGGAWWASRKMILTEDEAIRIGVSRVASTDRSKNLELPAVQALLEQGRAAWRGLCAVLAGTGLQVIATLLALWS